MTLDTRAPVRQTARWVDLVYGGAPEHDDPAEMFHEASKVSRRQIGRQIEGARRLEATPELQLSTSRSVKRLNGAHVPLPPPRRPRQALWRAIAARRSGRLYDPAALDDDELAALLQAGYGVTAIVPVEGGRSSLALRAVPSGGALYPLEIYVAALRVSGIAPGLYHFDPLRSHLETVRAGLDSNEVAALSTYPEIVEACGALLLVAAVFGRTRFKYGVRGYRFALLEAGHVGQNVILTATALGLAAVPLGGFYDRPTDEFLGLDGVNESVLYTIAAGRHGNG